jgi:hypothetical protein
MVQQIVNDVEKHQFQNNQKHHNTFRASVGAGFFDRRANANTRRIKDKFSGVSVSHQFSNSIGYPVGASTTKYVN